MTWQTVHEHIVADAFRFKNSSSALDTHHITISTSCAQVHELPRSHSSDNREGTFFHDNILCLSCFCEIEIEHSVYHIYFSCSHYKQLNGALIGTTFVMLAVHEEVALMSSS